MLPWGLRWRVWVWGKVWIYRKLWRDHWVVVILAGVGVLFLFRLVFSF